MTRIYVEHKGYLMEMNEGIDPNDGLPNPFKDIVLKKRHTPYNAEMAEIMPKNQCGACHKFVRNDHTLTCAGCMEITCNNCMVFSESFCVVCHRENCDVCQ